MFLHAFSKGFQQYGFKICSSIVTKNVWAILDFFTDRTFFLACTLHYKLKKIFFKKNPLNYFSIKVTKICEF